MSNSQSLLTHLISFVAGMSVNTRGKRINGVGPSPARPVLRPWRQVRVLLFAPDRRTFVPASRSTDVSSAYRVPTRIYGVDFSAASRAAGENTWVTSAKVTDDGIRVTECAPAVDTFGCAPDRASAVEALQEFIAGLDGETAVGLDFPFGLPRFLVESVGASTWREFLDWFPGDLGTPDEFSEWGAARTRAHTDSERTYALRTTDESRGAKSPYGFITKYPTYYGLRDVLSPLVREGSIVVPPVDDPIGRKDRPIVLETYPAAILEQRAVYRESYKKATPEARSRRAVNCDALLTDTNARLEDGLRGRIVNDAGGDGLDSLAATVAAYINSRTVEALQGDDPDHRLEARIYV